LASEIKTSQIKIRKFNVMISPNGPRLLDVRNLTVHHGQLRALPDISLTIAEGEAYAIIDANGAPAPNERPVAMPTAVATGQRCGGAQWGCAAR
jgi:hypothetical protein